MTGRPLAHVLASAGVILAAIGCAGGSRSSTLPAPVVELAGVSELQAVRRNATDRLLLVNFWATWCVPCVTEFPELEKTYALYRDRGLDFVAIAVNTPDERPEVEAFLNKYGAGSHRNLLFASPDAYGLQTSFDEETPAAVPYTMLIAPNGEVVHRERGAANIPNLQRAIATHLYAAEKIGRPSVR